MPLETDNVVLNIENLVTGTLNFASGTEAIRIGIEFRMTMISGSWFANLSAGINYYDYIFGRNFNHGRAREEFINACLRTPGVSRVINLQLVLDSATRELTVSWEVETEFDDTVTVSGEFIT